MAHTDRHNKLVAVMAKADLLPAIKALGKRGSIRAKQRAIALYLMHENLTGDGSTWQEYDGRVDKHSLERVLERNGVMNRANFTINMKKDSTFNPKRALWTVHYGYSRGPSHWKLTEKGKALAKVVWDAVNETYARIQESIRNSFTIREARISCPYCGDYVTDDDSVKCDACGAGAHYTCWDEIKITDRCLNNRGGYNANMCSNRQMTVVAKPEGYVSPERENIDKCHTCKGSGIRTIVKTAGVEGCSGCDYTECYEHPVIVSNSECENCSGTGDRNKKKKEETPAEKPKATRGSLSIRIRRRADAPVTNGVEGDD